MSNKKTKGKYCSFQALRSSIAVTLLWMGTTVGAATHLLPDQHHFISVNGALGYTAVTNNVVDVALGSGVNTSIGVGYRLFHNSFLFSAGIDGSYRFVTHSMADSRCQLDMIDTEGMPFKMDADATNGADVCHAVNLNIPILVGGEFQRFYFLVGPMLSVNLWGSTSAKAMLTTTGEYDRYFDHFEDMPNHYFSTVPLSSGTQSVSFQIDVLAHAEIGWRLGKFYSQTGADVPKPKQRYYIALYADYGLLNIHRNVAKGDRLSYEETELQGLQFNLTPALLSTELKGAQLHQFSVGIKVTFLFELPQRKICVFCRD